MYTNTWWETEFRGCVSCPNDLRASIPDAFRVVAPWTLESLYWCQVSLMSLWCRDGMLSVWCLFDVLLMYRCWICRCVVSSMSRWLVWFLNDVLLSCCLAWLHCQPARSQEEFSRKAFNHSTHITQMHHPPDTSTWANTSIRANTSTQANTHITQTYLSNTSLKLKHITQTSLKHITQTESSLKLKHVTQITSLKHIKSNTSIKRINSNTSNQTHQSSTSTQTHQIKHINQAHQLKHVKSNTSIKRINSNTSNQTHQSSTSTQTHQTRHIKSNTSSQTPELNTALTAHVSQIHQTNLPVRPSKLTDLSAVIETTNEYKICPFVISSLTDKSLFTSSSN